MPLLMLATSSGIPVTRLLVLISEPTCVAVPPLMRYTSIARSVVALPHGSAHCSTIVAVWWAPSVPIVWIVSTAGPGSKSSNDVPLNVPSQLCWASLPAATKYATPAALARSTACATTSSWKNGSVM